MSSRDLNNADELENKMEFKISDSFVRNITGLRNIYLILSLVFFAGFCFLIAESKSIHLNFIIGLTSIVIFGFTGFWEKYRKSIVSKKVLTTKDSVCLDSNGNKTKLHWPSIDVAYVTYSRDTLVLQNSNKESIKIESAYKDYLVLFNHVLTYLKAKVNNKLTKSVCKKTSQIIPIFFGLLLLYVDGIALASPTIEISADFYYFNTLFVGIILVYKLWPKITRVTVSDSHFEVYTQYGLKKKCRLKELEEVSFTCLSDLNNKSYRLFCELAFGTDSSTRFSMAGWDYVELFNLFQSNNVKININQVS